MQMQLNPAMSRIQAQPANVRFGGAKDEVEDATAMLGDGRSVFHDIFSGSVPLNYLASIKTSLDPVRAAKFKAYGQLINIALRKVGGTPEAEAQALATLRNPSPEMKQWMTDLKLTSEQFEKAIVNPYEIDKDAHVPSEVLGRMRDLGILRLKAPKEYGGMGLSQMEYESVIRALSHTMGTLTAIVSANSTIGSAPLVMYGTKEQQDKYLPLIAKSDFLSAFALTEPAAGTDVKKAKTVAKLSEDGKKWIVNGEKIYITNTHRSGLMYLFTQTDLSKFTEGRNVRVKPTVFILEPGFTIADTKEETEQKRLNLAKEGLHLDPPLQLMMIRGSNQAHMTFKDYEVTPERVLGGMGNVRELPWPELNALYDNMVKEKPYLAKKGIKLDALVRAYAQQKKIAPDKQREYVDNLLGGVNRGERVIYNALNKGRAGFGPSYSESANLLTQAAYKHAHKREMFDMFAPKGQKTGYQYMMPKTHEYLAEMSSKAAGLNALTKLVTGIIEADPVTDDVSKKRNIIADAAMIKSYSTEVNFDVAEIAMRVFGGQGTEKENALGIERAFRDAWIGIIVEGVNEAMDQLVTGIGMHPLLNILQSMQSKSPSKMFKALTNVAKAKTLGKTQTGGLALGDVLWLQRYAGKLNNKVMMKMGPAKFLQGDPLALMKEQRNLIRLANAATNILAVAASMLELKNNAELTEAGRLDLKKFIKDTRKDTDRILKEIKAYGRGNKDDALATKVTMAHIDEIAPKATPVKAEEPVKTAKAEAK